MNLGPAEILVILVLALLVFGPKRLPEVGRQIGSAMREIRKVQHTVQSEINDALREPAPTLPPAATNGAAVSGVEPDDHESDSAASREASDAKAAPESSVGSEPEPVDGNPSPSPDTTSPPD